MQRPALASSWTVSECTSPDKEISACGCPRSAHRLHIRLAFSNLRGRAEVEAAHGSHQSASDVLEINGKGENVITLDLT